MSETMDYYRNLEANEEMFDTDSEDLIDEKMQEAIHRISIEQKRLLALAFHEGYDGVDIHMDTSIVTDHGDFSIGFEYEAWEGQPPTIDRWNRDVRRYDFRTLDEWEERQLLARIGVMERQNE